MQENSRLMGAEQLSNSDIQFIRKYRWTISSKSLPEYCAKKVEFDFRSKQIYLEICELVVGDLIPVHRWLGGVFSQENLIFWTFDDCGVPLYGFIFNGLDLIQDKSDFDYESLDASKRRVTLTYKNITRLGPEAYIPLEIQGKKLNNYFWQMKVNDLDPVSILVDGRPELNVDTINLQFLHGQVELPGRAKWNDLKIALNGQINKFLSEFSKINIIVAIELLNSKKETLETWTLKNVRLKNLVNDEDDKSHLVLSYN